MGHWTAVPFNAANFTGASGMTWTVSSGNIITNRYTYIGKTMIWLLSMTGSILGGSLSTSLILTPPNFAGIYCPNLASISNGGNFAGIVDAYDSSHIGCQKLDGSTFVAGALQLKFLVVVEIP
jgi:hypothetical protein